MTHVREVVGLNPGDVYWMLDGLDIFYIVKIELFVWKDQNKTKKRPGWPNLKNPSRVSFLIVWTLPASQLFSHLEERMSCKCNNIYTTVENVVWVVIAGAWRGCGASWARWSWQGCGVMTCFDVSEAISQLSFDFTLNWRGERKQKIDTKTLGQR